MRRRKAIITTIVFALSGLASSPVQAATPVPADGDYSCSTGFASPGPSSPSNPKFRIFDGEVSFGSQCSGIVVIPDGVTSFGNGAFMSSTLTSINIPSSLTTIEDYAFSFATSLTSITVDSANPYFSSSAGILFNKLGTTLVIYPAGKSGTSYAIPSSVTNIGDFAFFDATSLTSVTIPEGVTRIGKAAFDFAGSITSINLPSSVTTIEEYAFSRTTSLTSINIPSGVTSIGDYAFFSTSSLTSITIPASVTSFGNEVFNSATALTTVTFEPGSPLTRLGDSVFFGATSLRSINIPAGVTSIANSTFAYTSSLTSITIPAGVTSIGTYAFYEATSLNSICFLGNVAPTVGGNAFNNIAGPTTAYIKLLATGFTTTGTPPRWNGLEVAVGCYAVSYNTNGGSTITGQAFAGSIATPTAPTRTGYTFDGWSATNGGSVLTFPYTPASNSDVTLYAKWTAVAAPVVTPVVTPSPNVATPSPNVVTPAPNVVTPTSSVTTAKAISIQLPRFYISSSELTDSQKTELKGLVSKSGKKATFVITG
jgi:uncharacterized repeat protein (TIGR02543 family)